MFCEIGLGQVLGPSPGDAGKGPGKSPHADFILPKEIVRDLRRLYGHPTVEVGAILAEPAERLRRRIPFGAPHVGYIVTKVCPFPLPAFGRSVDGVERFRVVAADAPELVERRAEAVERGRLSG